MCRPACFLMINEFTLPSLNFLHFIFLYIIILLCCFNYSINQFFNVLLRYSYSLAIENAVSGKNKNCDTRLGVEVSTPRPSPSALWADRLSPQVRMMLKSCTWGKSKTSNPKLQTQFSLNPAKNKRRNTWDPKQ